MRIVRYHTGMKISRIAALAVFIIMAVTTPLAVLWPGAAPAGAASYNTINPDGDLGDWAADENMGADATKDLYLTWDESFLYIGWEGTDWGTEGNLFMYINTSAEGSRTSVEWDGTHTLPFKADHVFAVRDSTYYDLREFSGGSWNVIRNNGDWGEPAPFIGWTDDPVTEIALRRSDIGALDGVDIVIYAQWEDAHNVWASFPTDNPASGGGSEIFSHYYHIPTLTPGIPPNTVEVLENTGGVEPRDDAINLAIVWHQHQPYYKNVLTGKYEMPWVRVHASQEYLDSPKILMEHPGVTVTFNIVPSLIEQMEDYADGKVLDRNTEWLDKGIDGLTELEKHTMQFEFFWVPSWQYNMDSEASRFYHYLHNKTMHNLTPETIMMDTLLPDDELFDLMVLYHLFQISPWYIEGRYDEEERDEGLLALHDRYGGFKQEDLNYILERQMELVGSVMGVYKEARDRGQAEIITSPYAHPILPLLMMPGWYNEMGRFVQKEIWYDDVTEHLDMAREMYEGYFGEGPVGMWPSEQSVSQAVVAPIADSGIRWMISDEMVLSDSGFDTGDNNVLCRPYVVEDGGKKVHMVFRDRVISDRIAWQYGKMDAKAAVDDFLAYVGEVRSSLSDPGDSILTVALDGENWMFMSFDERDNGRLFLDELYGRLENTDWIRTVGVWDHINSHPPVPSRDTIDVLARDCPNGAGSWIDGTMSTWSGEEEESLGWERLIAARDLVAARQKEDPADPDLPAAWKSVYAAEGSDWFWWYGLDQDSGYDELWDELFKIHLMNIYTSLGEDLPPYLKNLWLPPEEPVRRATDVIDPGIDGHAIPGEWDGAYAFEDGDDAPVAGQWDIEGVEVGYSSRNLYVKIDMAQEDLHYLAEGGDAEIALYVGAPNARDMNIFSTNYVTKHGENPLNYPARWRIKVLLDEVLTSGRTKFALYEADGKENWVYKLDKTGDDAAVGEVIEMAVPFKTLGIAAGDEFRLRAVIANTSSGKDMDIAPKFPMSVTVPRDVSPEVVLYRLNDTVGDEKGDGDYVYPLAGDFKPGHGLWDIVSTEISATEYDLIFRLEFAELTNAWHLRQGFSHEIIQIYVDRDRKAGSGQIGMLPGANAEVEPAFAWEAVISATGDSVFVQQASGKKAATGCEASGSEETRIVEIIASKTLVGSDVAAYGYVVVVGSQDGFGTGKWRDVDVTPGVWTLGGGAAPNAADGKDYDPGIIDAALSPEDEPEQASIIGGYDVGTKKYARIPGITIPEIEQQIYGVKTKGITATGAIITWQTTKPGTSLVEYGTSETLGKSTGEDAEPDTAHTVILEGLSASTTYHFRVGSRDGADGERSYSDILYFNTTASEDDVPPMILLPGIDVINETVAEVHFLTDEVARGRVEYGENENELADTGWSDAFGKTHSFILSGLRAGATYYYRVWARDSSGNENDTGILAFFMTFGDDDDDDAGPAGGVGRVFRARAEGIGIGAGSFRSVEVKGAGAGDVLLVKGEVEKGEMDVLVMDRLNFSKYNGTLSGSPGYFSHYGTASRLSVAGPFDLLFVLPRSGTVVVVFDNTPAPLGGGRGDTNCTFGYEVELTRGAGGGGSDHNLSYGALPAETHDRSLFLLSGSYGYLELTDCEKGYRVRVELETDGEKVDVLLFSGSDYREYRIERSSRHLSYSFLTEGSRLNAARLDYVLVIPTDGTYYLVIDNTPIPSGGADSGRKVRVDVRITVDRTAPPLAVDYSGLSEREKVEVSPIIGTEDHMEYVLLAGAVLIGVIVVVIAYVWMRVRKVEGAMKRRREERADGTGGRVDEGGEGGRRNKKGDDRKESGGDGL